ncbi:MAG: SgcJ/EcaC family oxidoreductase [Ktedonobacteraceae bacterium]
MHNLSHLQRREADEAAIRTLCQQLNEAWGDADTFAAAFTEDADYITFDGTSTKGRTAIAQVHRPLFEGFMKGSRLTGQTPTVRLLAPDIALVHSMGAVIQRHQKQPSRRSLSVQTMVAVKQEDHWLFTAFQNTRYRPFTQTLFGRLLTLFARRPSHVRM